jgi:hypothetical protein
MTDSILTGIVARKEHRITPLHALMPNRVTRILLVSSMYDSFTFSEEGGLGELLFAEYLELNLRFAPQIEHVSSADEALNQLRNGHFDLVIAMRRVGEQDIRQFSMNVHELTPELPVILLAFNTRELELIDVKSLLHVDRIFVWQGDHRLFVAIIKYIEDRLNVDHDISIAGVYTIILVEDSPRFYSRYLPMLYSELVRQTQNLMADTANTMQRLIRMRARPKILLATTFEEGIELYSRYKEHVLGVIVDATFPRNGVRDHSAGLELARTVKLQNPGCPVLMQSSELTVERFAHSINAGFIHKQSPSLLAEVRNYMHAHLGFGDFIFRLPDGTEIARARSLEGLARAILRIPKESLLYHARQNHVSTWLLARTEFDLAYELRRLGADDFNTTKALRRHLHSAIMDRREQVTGGVVAEFSRAAFKGQQMFVRFGTGSLGGKGRGLAFMNSLFNEYRIKRHFPGTRIFVPPTAILSTSVFDQFLEENGLQEFVLDQEYGDEEITRRFRKSSFPSDARSGLRRFLKSIKYPLAVRSSSLLEDASFQPFAGVYKTCMIPNNDPSLDLRLEELLTAIKLVYASTYFRDARSYLEATPNRLEEEKMAVVIQQLVGRKHEHYHYPDIAGSARSRDFYPVEGMRPEEGIAITALGLGNIVMDGGNGLRFSPHHPNRLYQFASVNDYLKNSQREFYALDLDKQKPCSEAEYSSAEFNLARLDLAAAERHETLHAVGSVYSAENQAIYDGLSRSGQRLITMAGVLKNDLFPLADVLKFLLAVGEAGFSAPVEMEFAIKLRTRPEDLHEFGFLQVRPLGAGLDVSEVHVEKIAPENTVCISQRVLGNGILDTVHDILYVRPDTFDRGQTAEVARQIGEINRKLKAEDRHCILIGQGRWGSSDRWLGIPVGWSQISQARCIVETDLPDIRVEPSQGTHFFQNITSLGISYFTINFGSGDNRVDYEWLAGLPAQNQMEYVRHVRAETPFQIVVDGRKGIGVVMKAGCRVLHPAGSPRPEIVCN